MTGVQTCALPILPPPEDPPLRAAVITLSDKGSRGEREGLTPKQILLLIIGLLIAITAYWRVLVALGGNLQLIDSITTVLSIVAFLLQIGRFMEQWILWMIINVFSITMWSLLLGTPEGSVTMIIMFSAYLINGVYGFRNWLKLSKVN